MPPRTRRGKLYTEEQQQATIAKQLRHAQRKEEHKLERARQGKQQVIRPEDWLGRADHVD